MIQRFCALTVLASGLVFATVAFSEQPTRSQLRAVAESAGATAAGFSVCGDSAKAARIKSKFQTIAAICTDTNSENDDAMNAFDLAYANTLNAGGACRGQNEARFDTVIDVLNRARDSC
jgi:hypothetical protein